MKTIVYFHGYGSSSKTDKVDRIRKFFGDSVEVLAFDANVDPDIAVKEVGDQILQHIAGDPDEDDMVFVGTSLGAWLAAELSDQFGCRAILINPASNPAVTLKKYGVRDELRNKYTKINLNNLSKKSFFIDDLDEVIDHSALMLELHGVSDVTFISGAGHRCHGAEFEAILATI